MGEYVYGHLDGGAAGGLRNARALADVAVKAVIENLDSVR